MSQTPTDSPYRWRPDDLEAIRIALSIPAQIAAIRAINDAMADLEQLYPHAILTARRELDAIGAIDAELTGLGPEQLQAPIETRRKAVGPDALPAERCAELLPLGHCHLGPCLARCCSPMPMPASCCSPTPFPASSIPSALAGSYGTAAPQLLRLPLLPAA